MIKTEKIPHPFSVQTAFAIALGHENTANYLHKRYMTIVSQPIDNHFDTNRAMEFAGTSIQLITNLALSAELYLKILNFQSIGSYKLPAGKKNHSISELSKNLGDDLFNQLSLEYQTQLDQSILSDNFLLQIKFNDHEPCVLPLYSTYLEAITYIDNSYSRWRYIYEEFTETFNVSDVLKPYYCVVYTVKKFVLGHVGEKKVIAD